MTTREKQKNKALQQGEHIIEPSQLRSAVSSSPNVWSYEFSGVRNVFCSLQVGSEAVSQAVKPVDVGDGIIYPPEMPKKSSRPTSMEIKRVSFEGVDESQDDSMAEEKG